MSTTPKSGLIKPSALPIRPPMLETRELVKSYGSLRACDGVRMSVHDGEIHALIGPNGAGKSTLIHLLSGFIEPDAGQVMLDGEDVTGSDMRKRVIAGISRSFQTTNVFQRMSVIENLLLAVQAREGATFSFWKNRDNDAALVAQACVLAERCGLPESVFAQPAGLLAHGAQRQLEFALALAAQPQVLLLDEPMAGMGPDESAKMTALIESLRGKITIVLVEHDMQAVFALADRISVLVYGRIIATDTPDKIASHATVREAYLGDEVVKLDTGTTSLQVAQC